MNAEIAWAAGLFEGEGHFTVKARGEGYRSYLIMGVTSTDADVLDRFQRAVGVGVIANKGQGRVRRSHWKPCYAWTASNHQAERAGMMLLPHLGQRRQQRFLDAVSEIDVSLPQPRACEECATTFTPNVKRQRFCGEKCRDRAKYTRRKQVAAV